MMKLLYCLALLHGYFVSNTLGWCLDNDTGECSFHIRSKAPINVARNIKFHDNEEKVKGVLEFSPALNDLKIFLGGDNVELYQCFQFTAAGFVGIGVKDPRYQVDVANNNDVSVVKLEGVKNANGVCSGVRFGDFASKSSANLLYDPERKLLGVSFLPGPTPPNFILDAKESTFQISAEAPAGASRIDSDGTFFLSQAGPAVTRHGKIVFEKSRGIKVSVPQIVLRDDILGSLEFNGFHGQGFQSVASIQGVVDGQITVGKLGARLEFSTQSAGEASMEPRAVLNGEKFLLSVNLEVESGRSIKVHEGSITIAKGDIDVGGDLTVLKGATFGDLVEVSKGGFVLKEGSLQMDGQGSISVANGDIDVAKGDITCSGALKALESIATSGKLSVGKEAEIGGSLQVGGDKLVLSGDLEGKGGAIFEKGVLVKDGDNEFNGNVKMKSGISIGPDAKPMFQIDPKDQSFHLAGQTVQMTGTKVSIKEGTLEVDGIASFSSTLSVTKSLDIGEDINVAGNAIFTGVQDTTSPETGAAVFKGGVGIEKSLSIGDHLHLGSAASLSANEDGAVQIEGKSLSFGKDMQLIIAGGLSLQDGSTFTSDGDLLLKGKATFEQMINIKGEINGESSCSIHGNLQVQGDSSFGGKLVASNLEIQNVLVENSTTIKGSLAVEGTITLQSPTPIVVAQTPIHLVSTEEGKTFTLHPNDGLTVEKSSVALKETAFDVTGPTFSVKSPTVHIVDGTIQLGDLTTVFSNNNQIGLTIDSLLGVHGLAEDAGTQLLVNKTLSIDATDIQISAQSKTTVESQESMTIRSDKGNIQAMGNVIQLVAGQGISLTLAPDAESILKLSSDDTNELISVKTEEFAFLGGTISAKQMQVDESICGASNCVRFLDGSIEVGTNKDIVVESDKVKINGPLELHGTVTSPSSVVLTPNIVTVANNGVTRFEIDAAQSGFVVIKEDAGYVQPTQQGKEGVVNIVILSPEAQVGKILYLFNGCAHHNVQIGDDGSIIPSNQMIILMNTGDKWVLPSNPVLDTVTIQNVQSLTATNDLDIGNVSFTAAGFQVASLRKKETSSEETVTQRERMATIDEEGRLSASNAIEIDHIVHIQKLSGFQMEGTIDGQGNNITNVTIVGGSLKNIRSLEVGLLSELSDERLKRNITPVDSTQALDQVLALQGVRYNDLTNEEPQIGLIAQNVETVIPEVIQESGSSIYKSVQYSRLVPMLIESVKALEKRVKELEAKLDALS